MTNTAFLIGVCIFISTTVPSCSSNDDVEAKSPSDSTSVASYSDSVNMSLSEIIAVDKNETLEAAAESRVHVDTVSTFSQTTEELQDDVYDRRNKFITIAPSIKFHGEEFYIVEGDLRYTKQELVGYFNQRLQNKDTNHLKRKSANELSVAQKDNRYDIWPPGKVIRYCVNKKSFTKKTSYLQLVNLMNQATTDWMNTCNVRFQYRPELDTKKIDIEEEGPKRVDFIVHEINTGSKFIAQAFFPTDPDYKHYLFIDPSYYTTKLNKTGILRHELGHILGYRHEHIWSKEEECAGERVIEEFLGAIQLTEYDPWSVMHYLCGRYGDSALRITQFDREGAIKIYGPPNNRK